MTFRNTGKRDSGNTVSRDSAYLSANDGLLIPACSADKSIVIYDVLSYGSGKLGTAVDGGGTQLCLINAGQNHFGISVIVPAGQGVYTNTSSGNITVTYAIVDGLPVSSIRNTVTEGGGATTTTTTAAATTTTTTTAAATTTTTTTAAPVSNACVAQTSGNEYYWNVDSTFTPVVGANATHYSRTQYVNADGSLWLAYNGTESLWKINDGVNGGGSNWYESDDDGTNPWDAAWTNGSIGVTEKNGQGSNEASWMHCYDDDTPNFCIAGQGSYPEYEGTWVPYNTYGTHNKTVYWNQTAGSINLFMWYDDTNAKWKINENGWEPHENNGYSSNYLESDVSSYVTRPSGANWSTEIANGTFDSIDSGDCPPVGTPNYHVTHCDGVSGTIVIDDVSFMGPVSIGDFVYWSDVNANGYCGEVTATGQGGTAVGSLSDGTDYGNCIDCCGLNGC